MTPIREALHQCTLNMYRDFFEQSASQKVLKVVLPIIVALAATVYLIQRSMRADIAKDKGDIINKGERDRYNLADLARSVDLSTLKGEEIDYSNKKSIRCAVNPNTADEFASIDHAENFFDLLKDKNNSISWMGESQLEKMDKSEFLELSQQWIDRGGKFFYPDVGNPVVIENDTLCSPWCLSGKSCSVVVYDFLRKAKHHETLLPGEISKYSSALDAVSPSRKQRKDALKAIIGLPLKDVSLNNKLTKESGDFQTSLTHLFKQQVKLDKPVELLVFAEAVPLLMKEIMARTGDKRLDNMTLVAFHFSDPISDPTETNIEKDIRSFQTEVLAQYICVEPESEDISL